MAKKENNTKYILGGVVIVILLIAIIVVYSSKPQEKEKLTEEDFKIINANWDTYRMKYSDGEGLIVDTPKIEYDWNLICGCSEKPCTTSAWHITTQSSEELVCENMIDGFDDDSNVELGSGSVIHKGVTKISFVEGETGNIYTNFDVTKNHEIIVCCASRNKVGKICDSVTLPAKC